MSEEEQDQIIGRVTRELKAAQSQAARAQEGLAKYARQYTELGQLLDRFLRDPLGAGAVPGIANLEAQFRSVTPESVIALAQEFHQATLNVRQLQEKLDRLL